MRAGQAIPMFAAALLLGANTVGTVDTVRMRVRDAVSTTTVTSGSVASDQTSDPVAAVEAKVPKDAETKLRFEKARIKLRHDGLSATFAAPVGWKPSHEAFPSKLAPPGRKMGEEGWLTHLDVGTSCDGVCAPKDWESVIAKNAKDAVPSNPRTREERLANGRLVRWTTTEDGAYVYAAWFVPGESRYYSCSAWLKEKALISYVDAFVEICKTAKVEER